MIPFVPPLRAVPLVLALLASIIVSTGGAHAQNERVTTPEIVAASSNLSCMDWKITGLCFWLECSPLCSVKTSLHVEHYSPSLVVSAYDQTGKSPWTETRGLYGFAQTQAHKLAYSVQGVNMSGETASGRMVNRSGQGAKREDLIFKAADVIGSPGNVANIAANFGFPLFCPMTDIRAFYPYFLSGIDTISWTTGTFELINLASWVPGMREIGYGPSPTNPLGNSWGPLYPRHGFVDQPDDPKAGAVIAQRAADIVYQAGQPHIYRRVGSVSGAGDLGFKVWEPGELREADAENSVWQMLVPVKDDECAPFGEDDRPTDSEPNKPAWSDGRFTEANYTFLLWRPYACCKDEGSYVTRVRF